MDKRIGFHSLIDDLIDDCVCWCVRPYPDTIKRWQITLQMCTIGFRWDTLSTTKCL